MALILYIIIIPLGFCLVLSCSVIRKQDAVIERCRTRANSLERESDRHRADNEKIYRWLRRNGEFVIDEMTRELDVLATTRHTDMDSDRRLIYLFDCLSLMVLNGVAGTEDVTQEALRKKTEILRNRLRETVRK